MPQQQRGSDMRILGLCITGAIGLLSVVGSAAAEPTGDWMVGNGAAVVRIEPCGEAMCGAIAWTKRQNGVDAKNPDPAKRTRPLLGMPILIDMKPAADGSRWEGKVYNSEDGQTYASHIELKSPEILRIEGCVLGFLCGGENWMRTNADVAPRPISVTPTR
jgi:uncharacterized protein (DUF2147 family)